MKKIFTLSLVLALSATAYSDEIKLLSAGEGIPGIDVPQLIGFSISPNGKYVCGFIELGAGIFVADATTDEVKYHIVTYEDGAELRHVDNNGLS
ncbi:MAG: hypothetical protein K2K97_05825, partial [Muribaculaceae bacterium]|nr:hypothetical protein [Muribaculaceae bacterium]